MHKLYVCQTCQRDAPALPSGATRGAALTEAVVPLLAASDVGDAVMLVRVACLNGCPRPCNVALRAPGKFALRLSRLDPQHAPALVALAAAYLAHERGDIDVADLPAALRDRLSACTPPPGLIGRRIDGA